MSAERYPPYRPPRWLRNGHVNTFYSFLRPRRVRLPPADDAWIEVAAGVKILLRCHWQARPAPALLLLHGLEGDSEAGYMRTTAAKAWRRGWHALRMNVRGCGASEPACATLYNSGLSGDLARAVAWVLADPRTAALALCGFSMGGNTVLKYVGELGAAAAGGGVRAAVAISACLDLAPSADALHRPACRLYERRFLRRLRRRVMRHARRAPGRIPWERLRGVRSIRDFDDAIVAPLFGYRGAADYYDRASAARVLDAIRVPTLVIHAEDDPFIVIGSRARRLLAANPAIEFLATRDGGHCAFMNPGGRLPGGVRDPDVYWAENRALEFCARVWAPLPPAGFSSADW